jgi:hypothetical protein
VKLFQLISNNFSSPAGKESKLFFFVVLYITSLIPLIIGALTGVRGGSDYRYHLLPSVIFILILFSLVSGIKQDKVKYIFCILIVLYSVLIFSRALDARLFQSQLDDKLWRKIESVSSALPKLVITYNPYTSYVMPPYFTFAESDFQADWGIAGYFSWHQNFRPMIGKRIECSENNCKVAGYYGDSFEISVDSLKETIFIMSHTNINPKNLNISDFKVSNKFSDYLEYIELFPETSK